MCHITASVQPLYKPNDEKIGHKKDFGVGIGGYNIINLRYTEDTMFHSSLINNLESILSKVNEEGEQAGLHLTAKKTK